jgi:hypothetical protein
MSNSVALARPKLPEFASPASNLKMREGTYEEPPTALPY